MTSREALTTIGEIYEFEESEQAPWGDEIGKNELYKKEFAILRELVERDTPKKANRLKENYKGGRCVVCRGINIVGSNYCSECGQRLDWSEK